MRYFDPDAVGVLDEDREVSLAVFGILVRLMDHRPLAGENSLVDSQHGVPAVYGESGVMPSGPSEDVGSRIPALDFEKQNLQLWPVPRAEPVGTARLSSR